MPATFYIDENFTNTPFGEDPDGAGPALAYGFDSGNNVGGAIGSVVDGAGDTILVAPGVYGDNPNDPDRWEIEVTKSNLTIRGSTGTASDVVIDSDIGITGFVITADNVTIADLQVTGASSGTSPAVMANSVSNLALTNVEVVNNMWNGIQLTAVNGATLTDVKASSNGSDGLSAQNLTGTLTITRGEFNNNHTGMDITGDIDNPPSVNLTDVTVRYNDYHGASIWTADSVVVSGGTFSNNTWNGFEALATETSVSLTGVTVEDNGQTGASIAGSGIAVSVSGGSFNRNANRGLNLGSYITDATIEYAEFRDNAAGIEVGSYSTPTIRYNNISGNTTGLYQWAGSGGLSTAENNWWGSYTGPGATDGGGRTGDPIGGNAPELVVFTPFSYGEFRVDFDGDGLEDGHSSNPDPDDDDDGLSDVEEVAIGTDPLTLNTLDFGDAPDTAAGTGPGNYNTLSTDGGPRHVIVAGLFLGAGVDGETQAFQSAGADGDDNNSDDEDGPVDPAGDLSLVVGAAPSVELVVTNSTGSAAMLYGWIDYNSDGVFDNVTEQATPIAVSSGTAGASVTLVFPTVPAGAVDTTYARFRLSTDSAAAAPTGAAADGEVEDYQVSIASPTLSAELVGTTLTIADVDPTGKLNEVTVSQSGSDLVINDPVEQFASAPAGGSLSPDQHTLTIPLASVTELIVNLAGGGDVLNVRFTGGTNPVPGGGLTYNGGTGSNGLRVLDGAFHTSTFSYTNAHDGRVSLDPDGPGAAVESIITYTGLEPITSTIASDVVQLIYTGGDETITVTDAGGGQTTVVSTLGELTTFANPAARLEITATNGADTIDVNSLAGGYASLVVRGDTAADVNDVVNLKGTLTFAAGRGLDVADVGTVSLSTSSSDVTASGAGAVSIAALKNISMAAGSSIATVDGNITLDANQGTTATTGTFTGIWLTGAMIESTGAGSISLTGRGGTAGSSNEGVRIESGVAIQGGAGAVIVTGIGGGTDQSFNHGVFLVGTGSQITSGGDVRIFGFGGNSSASGNVGVYLAGSCQITSSGATVLVEGIGGGRLSSGNNHGVSAPGAITVTAAVGPGTIRGFGGNTTGSGGDYNHGVIVNGTTTQITSGGGALLVQGTGGGKGASSSNYGVYVAGGGTITGAVGTTVTVHGEGGNLTGTGYNNCGVTVYGAGSQITSGGGPVRVEGIGGGGSSDLNTGVFVTQGGTITGGNGASVTVHGEGGNSTGNNNYGVAVSWANSRITSTDGAVLVEGIGGGTGSSAGDHGVVVSQAGTITSGTGAAVTVTGTGGNSAGSSNTGVLVHGSSSRITSGGGTIELIGDAGGAASSFGIQTGYSGQITGAAAITLTADSMNLASTPSVNAGSNAVILRPRTAGTLIDLGGADVLTGSPLTLGLTGAELNSVTAGTLTLGDAASGTITLTGAIVLSASTDVELHSGGAIVFNPGSIDTGGGNLLLAPGTGSSVEPVTSGTDITAAEVSFASTLKINISGTTLDTEYWQLNVAGDVDLIGVTLDLAGSATLSGGETFTIVNNGGSNPITGSFVGLIEDAVISDFLGSGRDASITYLGGDGNDVVVTVVSGATASVVDRHLFYDNSYWDGNIAGPNGIDAGTDHDEDDDAIAPDKEALVGDGVAQATSLNYTNFSGGITGIMIDVSGLANPAGIDVSDFLFKYGNDDTPDDWTVADDSNSHSPSSVSARDLGGGVTRITITWDRLDRPATSHMAIPTRNWLQVTLLANADTGLPPGENDVFYFGNSAGDANYDGRTLQGDWNTVFPLIHPVNIAPLTSVADIDRSGKVLQGDRNPIVANVHPVARLNMITPPLVIPDPLVESSLDNPEALGAAADLMWAPDSNETIARLDGSNLIDHVLANLWDVQSAISDAPAGKFDHLTAKNSYLDEHAKLFIDTLPAVDGRPVAAVVVGRPPRGIDPRIVDRMDLSSIVSPERSVSADLNDFFSVVSVQRCKAAQRGVHGNEGASVVDAVFAEQSSVDRTIF